MRAAQLTETTKFASMYSFFNFCIQMLEVRKVQKLGRAAVILIFILHILEASSWQNFHRERLSTNASSNMSAIRIHFSKSPQDKLHVRNLVRCHQIPADCKTYMTTRLFDKMSLKHRFAKFIRTCAPKLQFISLIISIWSINFEASSASFLPLPVQQDIQHHKAKPTRHISSDPQIKSTDLTQSAYSETKYKWIFENGDVLLPEVIYAHGLKLTNPRLLGSGAGGAVFALHNEHLKTNELQQVALKVSWTASTKSVSNECHVLKKLEEASIRKYGSAISTIETCLGEVAYQADAARTIIILQPVFLDTQASSLQDFVSEPEKMNVAITLIIRTLLQILSENIVTIDVQPLISRDTGRVLFIDFTEAMILNSENTNSGATNPAIQNLISEMMLLIPESLHDNIVNNILLRELEKYPIGSQEIKEMLIEQLL
jgi:hypothetical protein